MASISHSCSDFDVLFDSLQSYQYYLLIDAMRLIILSFYLLTCTTASIKLQPVADVGEDNDVEYTVNQLLNSEYAIDPTLPSESPILNRALASSVSSQCWRTAIGILQVSMDPSIRADNAAVLCSSLSEIQLKRLALEIATCHMKDVHKSMYQNEDIKFTCSKSMISMETVQMCLQHITDMGFHTYTQFLPYIQILCTRKTQEFFLDHQQEVIHNIASNYAQIVAQSKELLALQTEQMKTLFEIPRLVKEQITSELKENLHDAKLQLDSLLRNETAKMNVLVTDVIDNMQHRDREHRDQMDDWTNYQSSMLLQQSREMERHRSLIEEHRFNVQELSETVAQTAKHMRPLLDLQSILQLASDGFSWVTFLLYFLGTFNVIWIATRLERCQQFRRYLFGLVCAEAVVEIVICSAVSYNIFSDRERFLYIKELRQWTILVECFAYVFGIIVSLLNSKSLESGANRLTVKSRGMNGEIGYSLEQNRVCSLIDLERPNSKVDFHQQCSVENKMGKTVITFPPAKSGLMSSGPYEKTSQQMESSQIFLPTRKIPTKVFDNISCSMQLPSRVIVSERIVDAQSHSNVTPGGFQDIKNETSSTPELDACDIHICQTEMKNASDEKMDVEKPSLKRSASMSSLPTETYIAKRIALTPL